VIRVIYRRAPFGRQGHEPGFVTGMRAICLSASDDAGPGCQPHATSRRPQVRQPPMPPRAPLANEPTKPNLHIPGPVCCECMILPGLPDIPTSACKYCGACKKPRAGSCSRRSPCCRSAVATVKHLTLRGLCFCASDGVGAGPKRESHNASPRRSAGVQRIRGVPRISH
jgi:hypothetical protein